MWISTTAALLLLGGAAASPRPAPTPAPHGLPADVMAEYLALEDEFSDAYNAWRSELMRVNAEYQEAYKADNNAPRPAYPEQVEPGFFPRFDRLAKAGHPGAKVWCLKNYISDAAADAQERDFTRRTIEVLMSHPDHHTDLPRIVSSQHSSYGQSRLSSAQVSGLLSLVETVALDNEVKSSAAYAAASMVPVAGLADKKVAALRIVSLRSLIKRYPNTKSAARATGVVFEKEKLQIGMIAPDIIGKDVDGNGMKLSDFRGKVTVIDFWGFW